MGVTALIFLAIGLVCIFVGRILLIGAAFGVSIWWGLGIFLPFGPLLFRLSYPDLAPLSRTLRLFALPCILGYFVLRPGPLSGSHYDQLLKRKDVPAAPANHYGIERVAKAIAPNLEQRRLDNNKEFERLKAWSEALRLKKRDLLHSDVQGNSAYNAELQQYNAAPAKATAAQKPLFGSAK